MAVLDEYVFPGALCAQRPTAGARGYALKNAPEIDLAGYAPDAQVAAPRPGVELPLWPELIRIPARSLKSTPCHRGTETQ